MRSSDDYRRSRRSRERLRVGVPRALLKLPPEGGHGRVWHRVLAALSAQARIVPIDSAGRASVAAAFRSPQVVLASGHEDLPPVRVPLVVQIHEAGWFEPALREVLNAEFLEHISSRTESAVRAAAHVIVPSNVARRDVLAAYQLDPAGVHAVHHGVDRGFNPGASGGSALVARTLGRGEVPYVLHAAMLHPRKNLAVLRQAMEGLAAEGFPHALVIAGRPPGDRPNWVDLERAASAELRGAPGRVVHVGQPSDSDLAALMTGADAVCLPSLYEGFGLTALEAMACGTPVVVSNRGALPEVVGDAGVVVDPTAQAVQGALRRVLSDAALSERLRRDGVERARLFSWEQTAAGWLKVLRLAARAPARGGGWRPYTRPR